MTGCSPILLLLKNEFLLQNYYTEYELIFLYRNIIFSMKYVLLCLYKKLQFQTLEFSYKTYGNKIVIFFTLDLRSLFYFFIVEIFRDYKFRQSIKFLFPCVNVLLHVSLHLFRINQSISISIVENRNLFISILNLLSKLS